MRLAFELVDSIKYIALLKVGIHTHSFIYIYIYKYLSMYVTGSVSLENTD